MYINTCFFLLRFCSLCFLAILFKILSAHCALRVEFIDPFLNLKDADGEFRWYKFDDGDVTEIKMDDEEELKAQCYGGEYM